MKHILEGCASTREVWLDGIPLDPKPSQSVHNHSPDGFNWGYGGSGPSQLALAIVLKIKGSPADYQDFKWQTIANIPQDEDFKIEFEL